MAIRLEIKARMEDGGPARATIVDGLSVKVDGRESAHPLRSFKIEGRAGQLVIAELVYAPEPWIDVDAIVSERYAFQFSRAEIVELSRAVEAVPVVGDSAAWRLVERLQRAIS